MLLSGSAREAAIYAVKVAQRARARNGQPPSIALADLLAVLSPEGQRDRVATADGETDYQLVSREWMTTQEAANLLGCSPRTMRRHASGLGGRIVGGRLLLDRRAVIEHKEGSTQ